MGWRSAVLLALVGLGLVLASRGREEPQPRAQLLAVPPAASGTETGAGFDRADGSRPLAFPADHGAHPTFRTEWWYYTGNLQAADGRHFGYQLTFFRRALMAPAARQPRPSRWAADQVYMAHLAVADVSSGRFLPFARFARAAAGLAGAEATPFAVWLEDWRVAEAAPGVVRLRAAQDDVAFDLLLVDRKGPVLQGERGYSRKGPQPDNASYYYSLTRLATTGTLQVGGQVYQVAGASWMDHEFSSNGLAAEQVGWDWLALQLDDGSELMLYQMRWADGRPDEFASGAIISPEGSVQRLGRADFQIAAGRTWRSPHSGATYPAQWTIRVPAAGLVLRVEPYLADQELNVSPTYWEGAVRSEGERHGRPVGGSGYVELTGYAGSLQGQLELIAVSLSLVATHLLASRAARGARSMRRASIPAMIASAPPARKAN